MDEQPSPQDLRLLVRILRGLRDWSQEDLALAADLDSSSISRYESGRMVPPPRTIERLAKAAGVPMSVLEACLLPALQATRKAMASYEKLLGLDLESAADELGSALSSAARAMVTSFQIELAVSEGEPWEPEED
jgi:transcriptional regulator with XRE-family HTH domain